MDLILSDIHADFKALQTILHLVNSKEFIEKYGQITRILNLGDVLERGTDPKAVLGKFHELSMQYTVESVMGNHDEAQVYGINLIGSSLESIDAHSKLSEDDFSFFNENKDGTFGRQQFVDKKNNIICVHGGPIDPKSIIPKNNRNDTWLYQKTWQRLSEEDFEYFSYSGYHYTASSAFQEAKSHLNNFIIFCGHQHKEGIIEFNGKNTQNLITEIDTTLEKIDNYTLEKKEIPINTDYSYIIRVGLGGPQGYYGKGFSHPHFGISSRDSRIVRLFSIET